MLEILMSEINFDVINVVPFRMQRQKRKIKSSFPK